MKRISRKPVPPTHNLAMDRPGEAEFSKTRAPYLPFAAVDNVFFSAGCQKPPSKKSLSSDNVETSSKITNNKFDNMNMSARVLEVISTFENISDNLSEGEIELHAISEEYFKDPVISDVESVDEEI